jgi:hypothetical protein
LCEKQIPHFVRDDRKIARTASAGKNRFLTWKRQTPEKKERFFVASLLRMTNEEVF